MISQIDRWINLLTVSFKVGVLIIAGLFLIYSVYSFFLCIIQSIEKVAKKRDIRILHKEFLIHVILFLFFSFIYVLIPGIQYIE